MKYKILEVKWVGSNLQVSFSTPYTSRESIGWGGEEARNLAKGNKYLEVIKDILKKREEGLDKRPKIDKKVIGKEFDTKT